MSIAVNGSSRAEERDDGRSKPDKGKVVPAGESGSVDAMDHETESMTDSPVPGESDDALSSMQPREGSVTGQAPGEPMEDDGSAVTGTSPKGEVDLLGVSDGHSTAEYAGEATSPSMQGTDGDSWSDTESRMQSPTGQATNGSQESKGSAVTGTSPKGEVDPLVDVEGYGISASSSGASESAIDGVGENARSAPKPRGESVMRVVIFGKQWEDMTPVTQETPGKEDVRRDANSISQICCIVVRFPKFFSGIWKTSSSLGTKYPIGSPGAPASRIFSKHGPVSMLSGSGSSVTAIPSPEQ